MNISIIDTVHLLAIGPGDVFIIEGVIRDLDGSLLRFKSNEAGDGYCLKDGNPIPPEWLAKFKDDSIHVSIVDEDIDSD